MSVLEEMAFAKSHRSSEAILHMDAERLDLNGSLRFIKRKPKRINAVFMQDNAQRWILLYAKLASNFAMRIFFSSQVVNRVFGFR